MQKILYVEDDLSLIDGLKYTLENSGYFVDNARTASEALARFKQDTYDLLLLDAEKVNGVWEQRLRIHYNCVGTIEIPSALPLPTPDVSVNTRKGVVVNYAPCDVAI